MRPTDAPAPVALARNAIASALQLPVASVPNDSLLDERRGAFVTLNGSSGLRGCIGRVQADRRVRVVVPDMAHAAAFRDPRFPPLARHEFESITIEVSLLSLPWRVDFPDQVVVGTHGVIVSRRGRRALLLPQVALEWNWSREDLLSQACRKAGIAPHAWRDGGVTIEVFTADVYREDRG